MDVWTWAREWGVAGMNWETEIDIHTLPCVKQMGPAVERRELSSVLCGDLDGGEGGGVRGRFKREEIYIYIYS